MLHSLAARVLIMTLDHHISPVQAIEWVTRRLPVTLRGYYEVAVFRLVLEEL